MADGDVYEVFAVVAGEARLHPVGTGAGSVEDPVRVPAVVLCRVAGVPVRGLPGVRFALSESGWILAPAT